jgi:hypothetical protein
MFGSSGCPMAIEHWTMNNRLLIGRRDAPLLPWQLSYGH